MICTKSAQFSHKMPQMALNLVFAKGLTLFQCFWQPKLAHTAPNEAQNFQKVTKFLLKNLRPRT